jgi:hypothetical protein
MHWEILIIPLIALGVWILGTLFKGEEDKTKKGVRRSANAGGGRRPVTDLDRFLEEARRRRESEDRQLVPAPPPPPPVRAPIARAPLREPPALPRQTPPRVAAPVVRRQDVPVAVPVAGPVSSTTSAAPVVASPGFQAPAPPAPVTTRDTRLSPIPQQVRSLLSKPQTAGTAFILREIFDRPLCKRRR